MDAGYGYEVHKELQVVEEVVGEAVSKFKKSHPERKLVIEVPDELIIVPMDAVLIEQVIINLLINSAIHAISATCTTLSVSVHDGFVYFSVKDDGDGIDPSIAAHVLQKGIQGLNEKIYSDSTRNFGIGLTVCNSIVTVHGGKMTIDNLPEGGACVSFSLPIKDQSSA